MLNKCATVAWLMACLSGRQDVNSVQSEVVDSPTAQQVTTRVSNLYNWVFSSQQKEDSLFEEIDVPNANAFVQNDEGCEESLSDVKIEAMFRASADDGVASLTPCTVDIDESSEHLWDGSHISCKEALNEIDRIGRRNGPDSKIMNMVVYRSDLPFYWAQEQYSVESVKFESIAIIDALRVIKLAMRHVEKLKQDDPSPDYPYDIAKLEKKVNYVFKHHSFPGRCLPPMSCEVSSLVVGNNKATLFPVFLYESCQKAMDTMRFVVRRPDEPITDLQICKRDKTTTRVCKINEFTSQKRNVARCARFNTGSLSDALEIIAVVEEQTKK